MDFVIPIGLTTYRIIFTDEKPAGRDAVIKTKSRTISIWRDSPAVAIEQAILAARRHELPAIHSIPLNRLSA